jgi:2,3-dihydroxyphenylpropionate 1,2-dioxygenase
MLTCISHSPIISICRKHPPELPQIDAALLACREAVERFTPDVIVMFGCDHYAGFHLDLMPPYCVGLAATAYDDVGGNPGPLNVPRERALALIESLRDQGFDPSASHQMKVDHGFSQPLKRLFGRNDAYPVIPIFLNAMAPPFSRFARSRALGEACGRHAVQTRTRTLFLASGGMSHHPVRYYPLLGTATPDVAAWQMAGSKGGSYTDEEWFTRLLAIHQDGAEMLASGKRTAADIRLDEGFDRRIIGWVQSGAIGEFDTLDPERMIETSGAGSLELHTWAAASAAHYAAGGARASEALYAPTIAYGIGYGMVYGPV